jgi:glycosyltransferase involved in cell wall biosynthesis
MVATRPATPVLARPSALFVGVTYVGHASRFATLEGLVERDPRLDARFARITGWRDGGLIERVPLVPRRVLGRLRALQEASALGWRRGNVAWTSAGALALPHLATGPRSRRPLVVDLDWTVAQQEEMAPFYYGRPPREGKALGRALRRERRLFARANVITAWSTWAAQGVLDTGVDPGRVRVIPPGVDLDRWPRPDRKPDVDSPLRLLFVGGDFERKGGNILLELLRTLFSGTCTLDIVTRDPSVQASDNVRVHQATPNSPELKRLFGAADLFVMPGQAEAFGIAYLEAMASGLPVIAGDSGGVHDIVEHDVTGWVVRPTIEAVADAIDQALACRASLPVLGRAGRARVEQRFDARVCARQVADTLLSLV